MGGFANPWVALLVLEMTKASKDKPSYQQHQIQQLFPVEAHIAEVRGEAVTDRRNRLSSEAHSL